jgi:hypothetical protein
MPKLIKFLLILAITLPSLVYAAVLKQNKSVDKLDFKGVIEAEPNNSTSQAQDITHRFNLSYSPDIGDETSNTSESIPHVTIKGSGDRSYDYYAFKVETADSTATFDIDYACKRLNESPLGLL